MIINIVSGKNQGLRENIINLFLFLIYNFFYLIKILVNILQTYFKKNGINMLITAQKHSNFQIYDAECKLIPYVSSFNTKTCEITVYIPRYNLGGVVMELDENKNLVPKLVTFVLDGAHAKDDKGNTIKS